MPVHHTAGHQAHDVVGAGLGLQPSRLPKRALREPDLSPKAQPLLQAVRQHWSIENAHHWVLDMAFGEDHSRSRTGHNMAILKRIARNLLRQD